MAVDPDGDLVDRCRADDADALRELLNRFKDTVYTAFARAVPDTATAPVRQRPPRRRARMATAIVLLVIAGGAGAYLVGHRVGPAGPGLSPTTVTVPTGPVVTP